MSRNFKDFKERMLIDETLKTEYDSLALEYKIVTDLIKVQNKENPKSKVLSVKRN